MRDEDTLRELFDLAHAAMFARSAPHDIMAVRGMGVHLEPYGGSLIDARLHDPSGIVSVVETGLGWPWTRRVIASEDFIAVQLSQTSEFGGGTIEQPVTFPREEPFRDPKDVLRAMARAAAPRLPVPMHVLVALTSLPGGRIAAAPSV